MVDISPITSIITLHINSLKSLIKKAEIISVDQNQTPTVCCLKKETTLNTKTHILKEQRRVYLGNINQNKVGVAVLITDRAEFRAQKEMYQGLRRELHNDKVSLYLVIKVSLCSKLKSLHSEIHLAKSCPLFLTPTKLPRT